MKRKKTLKEKMLILFMLCAMTSLLATGVVSYMALRMIRENSIEDNRKLCLNQITRDTDGAYYDMLSIANQMKPGGLVGNVTESYLGADDNYERFIRQRSLREELIGLEYVNTELIGVAYYDLGGKQELVGNMNVRELDESYVSLPEVVECAGNIMQAVHPSRLRIDDGPALSVRREVVFGNGRKLDIYVETEAAMEAPEELNKEKWPYTYIHMDQDGVV